MSGMKRFEFDAVFSTFRGLVRLQELNGLSQTIKKKRDGERYFLPRVLQVAEVLLKGFVCHLKIKKDCYASLKALQ